ncbi:MAG: histidine kinase dimerization/phospho-acceptor domain-containing protein [Gemmatimonadota bacterium]
MKHWTHAGTGSGESEFEDIVRFNEAIDKAIAESIHEYSKAVGQYRDMFLAVLGHDLRSPLNAVLNASEFLTEEARLSERDHGLVKAIRGGGPRGKRPAREIGGATGSGSILPGGWPRRTGESWRWSPPAEGARPSRFA